MKQEGKPIARRRMPEEKVGEQAASGVGRGAGEASGGACGNGT